MLLQINKGTVFFGANDVFENVDFSVNENERIALVGRNGSGKSTLLKVIEGEVELSSGQLIKSDKINIAYLKQNALINSNKTVKEEFEEVFSLLIEKERQLNDLAEKMAVNPDEQLINRYSRLEEEFKFEGGYTYQSEIMTVLHGFGFGLDDYERQVSSFSGGEKTKIAFAKLLLSKPDLLLLDEPTNHLDLSTIEWLESYLAKYKKAMIIVSHDRVFLDRLVSVVYELEYGSIRRYSGNYTSFVEQKKNDLIRQESAYNRQQKDIKRLEELIEKFRYKKNKAAFAQSKIKYLDRMDKIDAPTSDEKTFSAHFHCRIKGGKRVLNVDHLQIGYDTTLCEVNLEVLQGQRVAIIGPNGKGKSTFVKTIMGLVPQRGGEYLLGHQIEPGYFDQQLAQFTGTKTVLDELWDEYPLLDRTQIRTVLGSFLFTSDEVFKTVDVLSGGEKVRLQLAKLMLQQANLLILDEPTNHLDILGKEALEESLMDYEGTMLFVSHDRYFIQKLATAILVIEEGKATYYPLTYNEYVDKMAGVTPTVTPTKSTSVQAEPVKPERRKDMSREIKKIEALIDKKEKELDELRELRFDPEYYHDFRKMNELDNRIDDLHNEIAHLMETWEEYNA